MLSNINIHFYLIAYLVGAIPFGLILAKSFAKTNIKELGSKSIGATNVLRVLKQTNPNLAKKLAISTLFLDMLKGVLPIFIANLINLSAETQWTMAVLAVIGHCFSPYLKFEGGKGVATGAAVIAYFMPFEILIALAAWYIVGKVFKISSISSIAGLLALIISSFIIHYDVPHINTHAPVIIIAIIIIYKHIPNFTRMLQGQEEAVI